jgi:fatty-acyl-CoA synthase
VKAVVVVKQSHAGIKENEIIDWCRAQVSSYKVPRVVKFVDALPKSASGKVMWRALQELESQEVAPAG